MLNKYKIITASYKTAPFKALGSYVIGDDDTVISERLSAIKEQFDIDELFYLATCNRIIFLLVTDEGNGEQFKQSFLSEIYPDHDGATSTHFQLLSGDKAVLHLHRIACSMDSMVVGEREILRQMREAYDWSKDQSLNGDQIRILFDSMVNAAKHVYSNTRIGEKPVSIVSLAMLQLTKTSITSKSRVLLVGAGKTNNLVSKFLIKQGFTDVVVFNRSIDSAQKIADKFGSKAYTLPELKTYKGGFDAMIVCTGSVLPIITKPIYDRLLQGDTDRKVVVDLSVPYNVKDSVVESYDIDYISVEGLKVIAKENLNFRHREVDLAETMLIDGLSKFKKIYKERELETAFQEIPREIKAIRKHALENVFKKDFDQLDDQSKEVVEKMMAYMEKKCIGIPMKVVRQLAD